jgi:putative peptidoglycan lipid II flippase
MIPVTLACVLFRVEIVSAAFERGSFDENSTALTSSVFALYSLGILFIACNTIITNLFYGYGNTKTPMYISIANLIINVILNFILIKVWGVNGLALATSLSAIITFFVRIIAAGKYVTLDKKSIIINVVKVTVASVIACIIPRAVFWFINMNKFIVLAVSAAVGGLTYLILLKVLKVSELSDIINLLKKKVSK